MPLLDRVQSIRWRHAVIAAVVLLLEVTLFGVIAFAGGRSEGSTVRRANRRHRTRYRSPDEDDHNG